MGLGEHLEYARFRLAGRWAAIPRLRRMAWGIGLGAAVVIGLRLAHGRFDVTLYVSMGIVLAAVVIEALQQARR